MKVIRLPVVRTAQYDALLLRNLARRSPVTAETEAWHADRIRKMQAGLL